MKNVLSVDVEDYFHVEAFTSLIDFGQWDSYATRVERNVFRLLELFDKHGATATFFVLGWVAERFPHLAREIAAAGHEIGSHGYAHQRLMKLTPEQFRADIRRSVACLSDQVQRPIQCYRAPSFSIVKKTFWAFDILAEEGFLFDSSIFPIRHDLYGVPDGERFLHWRKASHGLPVLEFPPSTVRVGKNNWGVAGGGYLRLLPYHVTRWALRRINDVEQQPAMVYLHPWEIDPGQPRIRAGIRSNLRHYTNIATMYGKLEQLLKEFTFTTFSAVCSQYLADGRLSIPRRQHEIPGAHRNDGCLETEVVNAER